MTAADVPLQERALLAAVLLYQAHDVLRMDTAEDEALRERVLETAREFVPELPELVESLNDGAAS